MKNITLRTAAALAALAFAAPSALAQQISLIDRRTQLSANYLVGYATVSVSDVFNRTWDDLATSFQFATADSGSINDVYDNKPVQGLGSYDISQSYNIGERRIELGGEAHNTLAAAASYVSAGARATSTLWLDFNLSSPSGFSFSGQLDTTPGHAVGGTDAVATSTLILERRSGGNQRWAFDTPGAFNISGQLLAGDWRLYGNAHTRLNGDAAFSGALVLSPVPEPATWMLAMAGLPLLLRRAAWRRRAGAAVLLGATASALAAPGAVNTLGQPEYYTTYRLITPGGRGAFDISSHDDAINGTTAVFTSTGTMWDRSLANQQAVVTNNGVTYWSYAMGPTLQQAPEPTTVTGAITTADVFQSFQKVSADAELRFTYTGGKLELFKDPEMGPPCGPGCMFAAVTWRVTVTLNSDPNTEVMFERGHAALVVGGGNDVELITSQDALDGSPVNPLWQWDCTGCHRPPRNVATATLQAPFSGIVDLSAVPYDPQRPVEFTVGFSLTTTAFITQSHVGARAWARDPLGAADDGVSLAVQGLLPTNAPVVAVPEPQSWALMLGGAAWIAWRRRATEPR